MWLRHRIISSPLLLATRRRLLTGALMERNASEEADQAPYENYQKGGL